MANAHSVEVANSARSIDDPIAIARGRRGAGDNFGSAIQKYRQGDFHGALADYNRAIKNNPQSANAYYNRGLLKADKLQDSDGALSDYNRAIKLKSRNANSYYNRGILKYTYLKDATGGIADLQPAAKLAQRQGNTQETQAANDLLNQWQQTTGK